MKLETLRDLTEEEKKEIDNLDISGCTNTMQALLGIIANDLSDDGTEFFTWEELKKKINQKGTEEFPMYPAEGPAALLGILDRWIRSKTNYKGKGRVADIDPNTRGLESDIKVLIYTFSDMIFGYENGYTGKKQGEFSSFYEAMDEKYQLDQNIAAMYSYVLCCMEALGFQKMEYDIKMKNIPVGAISQDEICW